MNNSSFTLPADNVTTAPPGQDQFGLYSPIELLQIAAPQVVLIDRIATPIWYIIGLIGNPISAKIWLSRKVCKTNSSAVYFGSLAIVETIYLLLHMVSELQTAWGIQTYSTSIACELFNFLLITPQYLVPMLVLGFTTERYIAVCHPFVKEKYCTVSRAKIVIGCMSVVSISLGLVQIYIWSYDDMYGCVFRNPEGNFNSIWTWITESILFFILPVACLIINILVIVEIRRLSVQSVAHGQSQSSNAASTLTLLCVSFYFICTLLPATIVYAMQSSVEQGDSTLPIQQWCDDPTWSSYFTYLTIRKVVEEICLSNYATYIIIYYATGVYFRREFKQMFTCVLSRWKKDKLSRSNRAMMSDYSMSATNGRATCTETVALDSLESPSD